MARAIVAWDVTQPNSDSEQQHISQLCPGTIKCTALKNNKSYKMIIAWIINGNHSFIHSGYFYRASSNPLLLRGTPDYSIDTVSELTCRSATGNCEWRTCPRSQRDGWSEIRTCNLLDARHQIYHWATTPHFLLFIKWIREMSATEAVRMNFIDEVDGNH